MELEQKIAQVFAPFATDVENFANEHRLQVGKCLRGNSGWELTGEHSSGGEINLLLLYDDQHGIGIGSNWQFPCAEMNMLYAHFRPMRSVANIGDDITSNLTSELNTISNVRFGYWTHLQPLSNKPENAG